MISTCKNDFKRWSLRDRIFVREGFLKSESLDMIGKNCHRHAKKVCIELIRQGLIDESKNISKNHIKYTKKHDSDSESSSEYTPSECESEYDSDDDCESDYDSSSDYEDDIEHKKMIRPGLLLRVPDTIETVEVKNQVVLSDSDDSDDSDSYDAYNFDHNLKNIQNMMNNINICISNIVKLYTTLKNSS